MNLHNAIGVMITGNKVKLPEWKGYWFIPDHVEFDGGNAKSAVHVFTKEGEILNTPWFDKYAEREDFEEADGMFSFEIASLALKNGHSIQRKGWNGKNMFAYLIEGHKLQGILKYGYGEYLGEPTILSTFCLRSAQNQLILGWRPTPLDMISEDWCIFEAKDNNKRIKFYSENDAVGVNGVVAGTALDDKLYRHYAMLPIAIDCHSHGGTNSPGKVGEHLFLYDEGQWLEIIKKDETVPNAHYLIVVPLDLNYTIKINKANPIGIGKLRNAK